MPVKNEIGNTYNYLTVIERAENSKDGRAMWKCRCKCGNETIVSGKHLRSGNTKSCGCLHKEIMQSLGKEKHKDMIGKTYGFLTVLDYGDYYQKPDGRNEQLMRCRCERCGTITQVRPYDLQSGNQMACGCINSKGNTIIKLWLLQNNIPYKSEYRMEECKNQRPLPFDFALFKDEILIGLLEYQGIQHFSCENHGWDRPDKFEQIKINDEIKYQYCNNHNIKLYYITYKEDIEKRLEEIINELYSK